MRLDVVARHYWPIQRLRHRRTVWAAKADNEGQVSSTPPSAALQWAYDFTDTRRPPGRLETPPPVPKQPWQRVFPPPSRSCLTKPWPLATPVADRLPGSCPLSRITSLQGRAHRS